jgi:D-glutamate cyclase
LWETGGTINTGFDRIIRNGSLAALGKSLELFIQQDPGGRGLTKWAGTGGLFPAAVSLAGGRHVLILTGFYILSAGVIETDGPPGTVILANALCKAGKRVTILTDRHAEGIMRAGLRSIDCPAELVTYSKDDRIEYEAVIGSDTTHCIALERPGIAADGFHHNFRGLIISDHVAPLDDVFIKCASSGIITVGIGDGGNELGMGNVSHAVDAHIAPHRPYSCKILSDLCICSGVSNWTGYALAALLSRLFSKNLMPDASSFSSLLEEVVAAGAVDGVTGKRDLTVDALPRVWEDGVYERMLEVSSTDCD